MRCPVCQRGGFEQQELEPKLRALRCPTCGGHWIGAAQYWMWRNQHGPSLPERTPDHVESELPVTDTAKAKLCPECQRLLTRYRVGHGTSFVIERCGNCAGVWLDANEWESLRARNLHDDLHFIFSEAWQNAVGREQREQAREKLMTSKLGEADVDELKRIKAWLDNHPHKSELYAMLLNE